MRDPDILPITFNYDQKAKTVDVEYGDGSIVRYFGIDPRSAFLEPTNPHRNRDFQNFLGTSRIRQEVLQKATVILPEAESWNAISLNKMQNGVTQHNSNPAWIEKWGYEPNGKGVRNVDGVVDGDPIPLNGQTRTRVPSVEKSDEKTGTKAK